ncbi:hypothetical protein [Actinomadura sp. J1-007]|uniref:hypothetical protein n=1 Tax=Actinomadura sp. J1-007 TaxID=2661913 RepID=UPI00136E6908|nr:hypothetical protein [Actinomadura sp. J1-007]
MTSPRTDTPTGEPLSVPAGRDAGDPAPGPEPAGAERARLRRARCVVCYWTPAGVFTAHPYPHGHPVALDGPAATVLAAFTDWTTPGQARRMLDGAGHEPARGPGDEFTETVRRLREGGLLLAEHTERAARDADLAARWAPWGPRPRSCTTRPRTSPRPRRHPRHRAPSTPPRPIPAATPTPAPPGTAAEPVTAPMRTRVPRRSRHRCSTAIPRPTASCCPARCPI